MRASQISLPISGWTGGVSAAVLMIPVGPFAVVLVVPVGSPGLAALAAECSAQLIVLGLPYLEHEVFYAFLLYFLACSGNLPHPHTQTSLLSQSLLNTHAHFAFHS